MLVRYNVMRQWTSTFTACFALSQMLQVMVLLGTGANGGGYLMNKHKIVAADVAILFTTVLLNSLPIQYVDYLGLFSATWNFLGIHNSWPWQYQMSIDQQPVIPSTTLFL
jgi:hypothetical protein